MDAGPGVSPSFNSYFNSKFAEIAARVVGEYNPLEEFIFNFENDTELADDKEVQNSDQIPEEENEEFEFTFAPKGSDNSELFSPISAGEIFQNGQIRPVYPVFNRELLTEHVKSESKTPRIRVSLRKLFVEERETTLTTSSSSSSSEADNLVGVPAETYCLWQPKKVDEGAEEVSRVEKSSSTGSNSKRWKFSNFLHRSHSDGSNNDRLVILGPVISKMENKDKVKKTPVGGGKLKTTATPPPRPRNLSGCEKRQLTYRQELVGFFGRVM